MTSVPRGALATGSSTSHCLWLTIRLTPPGGREGEERNSNWAKGNIQTFAPQALVLQPRKAGRETLSAQPLNPTPGQGCRGADSPGVPTCWASPCEEGPRATRDAPPEV